MYKVEGKKITMTRGDTALIQVGITRDGAAYTPVEGDSVRFAVKTELNRKGTEYVDEEPLIEIQIPIDTMILRIDPEDTKSLPFRAYKYDIEITFSDGIVDTFINNEDFILAPEVH